jgi:hypothetical protein
VFGNAFLDTAVSLGFARATAMAQWSDVAKLADPGRHRCAVGLRTPCHKQNALKNQHHVRMVDGRPRVPPALLI